MDDLYDSLLRVGLSVSERHCRAGFSGGRIYTSRWEDGQRSVRDPSRRGPEIAHRFARTFGQERLERMAPESDVRIHLAQTQD